jgi:hypothetical protein
MKRFLVVAAGIFFGYTLLRWMSANPHQAAQTVNGSAKTVGQASNSLVAFMTSLGAPTLGILALIGLAYYFSRR